MTNSFIVIEQDILFNKNLTSTEKILYGVIVNFANNTGYCFATNKKIGEAMGISIGQVQRALRTLKKFNYVVIYLESNYKRRITPTIQKFIADRDQNNQNNLPLEDADWLGDDFEE